ncbi:MULTISPECIES: ATP-binding cassette domain-containing protein [unclassified Kribbella]|uniref:ATP-binding cassette domain-containing protein n=1 Tax=unclassified Kribbella TaxID=2644121 RepID=UPI003018BE3D
MADGMPLLRVRAVSKSFGAVAAVREVSFDLYGGEAHALVGENGAGKSTIVKMLAGVHRPDSGTIELNGVPTELHTPADAKAAGIAVIYQEPTLFPDLTVAENIAMGRQPLGRFKTIDRAAMVRQAAQLFTRLGVSIDPNRPARGLSITGAQGEKFKAGKLGEYTVGADGEIVLGPPTEFTATNIDQFNF